MCDAASLTPGETVLEIGPGTGILTKELLARGVQVIALETDPRAIAVLNDTFAEAIASGQLTIHHTDVRTGALSKFVPKTVCSYKIVANIPYYLSGLLFRAALTDPHQPTTVVFLVQKEVAKRAHTSPQQSKKQSLLSLSVAAYGKTRYVRTVSRGHFTPPPRVDSAIIAIEGISRDFFADCNEELFFSILKRGFANKRKQLVSNLTPDYPRDLLLKVLAELNLTTTVRAEDIDHATWKQLVQRLSTATPAL